MIFPVPNGFLALAGLALAELWVTRLPERPPRVRQRQAGYP